ASEVRSPRRALTAVQSMAAPGPEKRTWDPFRIYKVKKSPGPLFSFLFLLPFPFFHSIDGHLHPAITCLPREEQAEVGRRPGLLRAKGSLRGQHDVVARLPEQVQRRRGAALLRQRIGRPPPG